MNKKEKETMQVVAHEEICLAMFSNLEHLININHLARKTKYNWRTVRNHLRMMSMNYKEINKLKKITTQKYA